MERKKSVKRKVCPSKDKEMKPKLSLTGSKHWSDRELKDLAAALQRYGFAETQKIADAVKTKDANSVKYFINTRIVEARARYFNKKCSPYKGRNSRLVTKLDDVKTPPLHKWRKMAQNQMYSHVKSQNLSRQAIIALCQKFYDEEEEPEDPQLVNVKLMYKYILDCMSGEVPAQLPPKESAIMLAFLKQLREMVKNFDFSEEIEFIKNFKHATTFVPFAIKDEFKKKTQSDSSSDVQNQDPGAVRIPQDLYATFSRHKRVVQSFNPLMVPVWFLGKEQEYMAEVFKNSQK